MLGRFILNSETMKQHAMIKPLTTFSLRLANHLTCHPQFSNSNLAFSPLSLHSILSLLTTGSTGCTQQQLLSILGNTNAVSDLSKLHSHVSDVVLADGSASRGPCIRYASGVWVDDAPNTTLKKSFREIARSVYRAEAYPVPFHSEPEKCRTKINKWVEENTAGHIKNLLQPESIGTNTRLILGNALYFDGKWGLKFDLLCTESGSFHLIDGSMIETPFMSSTKRQFISVYDGFKVLKLPYKQGHDQRQFSFYIFLPNTCEGLLDLSTKLSSDPNFLNQHIPTERVCVDDFRIPKFKITTGYTFSDILENMGLVLPFTMTGDFSEIVDSPEVSRYYVSGIIHKCFVSINEAETVAAAASAISMESCAMYRENSIDFVADHPFLFLIREDTTGAVLFAGHLLNPLSSA